MVISRVLSGFINIEPGYLLKDVYKGIVLQELVPIHQRNFYKGFYRA